MFNVGVGELMVIMLIGLIVLGPDKLPDAARKVGNIIGELRRMSGGFQAEMRSTMNDVTRVPPVVAREEPASSPQHERRESAA